MAPVEQPFELLDLADGESVEFRVLRVERGTTVIETRLEPGGKEVPVIRIHVSPEDKEMGAPYWDVTSRTLQARLEAMLPQLVAARRRIRITKRGIAPMARHQVELL